MVSMSFETLMAKKKELGRPLIMGHRGAMGTAPENTMASFKQAVALGVEAVELDVHLSKDGRLVVIHDESVDRTTDGTGEVADLTLAELKALDAGSWFDAKFAGERIPTLEEVLAWAKDVVPVVIEVKFNRHIEQIVQATVMEVERLGAAGNVAVISFDHNVSFGVKSLRPDWMSGVLYVGRLVDPVGLAQASKANGLLPMWGMLTPDQVEKAHAAGLWVGVWAPNTEAELKHAIAMGADMIGTNYPARAHALFDAAKAGA
ncbi:MAG: glycerophosphoryl diester phosphodiesterase [Cyanobacteria bacterium RYN_339]|nr:glycerophosphoryl diester phosphodiesterase [Cyanobacteria bacterium RYN_339]